ncbi:MAG: helix-turn-helix domain-containing protein [Muribaculaceae bacterium]|nr:helix-turn-helix domain-containing protein [Muribaculaceae bacterium]
MEARLKEEINAYFLGEAIKKARLEQNLTQEQLGERIGVKKAQISRLEHGKRVITLPTLSKVFNALGINSGVLKLRDIGEIALW